MLQLHYQLVELFASQENPIFPPGPRDSGLVESACGRPWTALGDVEKYTSTEEKAAALFHSLVTNHPFHNGNKRTALVTLITFLWRNDRRFRVDASDDEVFDMVVAIANHTFCEPGSTPDDVVFELARWLDYRTISHKAKAPVMRTKDFLAACAHAGFAWKISGPSYVVWDKLHHIRFSRSTGKLAAPVVREYMSKLGLRDVCVDAFQAGLNPEGGEIQRFREVLRRLAHA